MHWVSDWMLALTLILTITLTWKGGASPWTRVPFFQVLCVRCRAGGQQLSLSRLLQSPRWVWGAALGHSRGPAGLLPCVLSVL